MLREQSNLENKEVTVHAHGFHDDEGDLETYDDTTTARGTIRRDGDIIYWDAPLDDISARLLFPTGEYETEETSETEESVMGVRVAENLIAIGYDLGDEGPYLALRRVY